MTLCRPGATLHRLFWFCGTEFAQGLVWSINQLFWRSQNNKSQKNPCILYVLSVHLRKWLLQLTSTLKCQILEYEGCCIFSLFFRKQCVFQLHRCTIDCQHDIWENTDCSLKSILVNLRRMKACRWKPTSWHGIIFLGHDAAHCFKVLTMSLSSLKN